ncbi:MAG TPA: EAL domain-containing protein [Usitatibacter sp.]|nr:EAL domain-containing protein [Usitatibacter sp.]
MEDGAVAVVAMTAVTGVAREKASTRARPQLPRRAWERVSGIASPWLAALGVVALVTAVLATMSLTSSRGKDSGFLGGVLTASVLAAVSRASNARWKLARRTAQLAAVRANLATESSGHASAEHALERLRERQRLVDESLPAMLAYVGPDGRLRYHNRAFARWLRLDDSAIDGRCVEELIGEAAFREAGPRLIEAFQGHDVRYERLQRARDGTRCHLLVHYFPTYLAQGKVDGVFALLCDVTEARGAAPAAPCANAPIDPTERLRSALEGDEFTLQFQPIASLGPAGEAPMGEVLLRMNEEEEKLLPPGGFIPVAEELGLLHELDRWVVGHVIDIAAAERAPAPLFLVNLWPQTVLDQGFPAFVLERLAARGVGAGGVCFELSVAELLEHRAAYCAFADRLRDVGCGIAICGFGGGEQAIAAIEELRPDYVKLDGALVLGMLRDAGTLARVRGAVEAARAAGLATIAECVESEVARAALARMGVCFAQGFGIARPQPIHPLRPVPAGEEEAVA